MQRDRAFDVAKGIVILLVIYGHLRYTVLNMDTIYGWIYSFHMPCFIYISGWLTKPKEEKVHMQILQKAKKILMPYLVWNFLGFCINRLFLVEEMQMSASQFVHGLLFGDDLRGNLPTWYLLSYLWIMLFAILVLPMLDSVKKLVLADAISILLVFVVSYFEQTQMYFRIRGAIVLLPFFITGYLLKKIRFELPWWAIPILLFAGYKLERINAVRSWRSVTVGNGDICIPYLYLASAMCTTLAVCALCRYLAKIPVGHVFEVYGKHTMFLLCTHWILGNICSTFMDYGYAMFGLVLIVLSCGVAVLEYLAYRKMKGIQYEK